MYWAKKTNGPGISPAGQLQSQPLSGFCLESQVYSIFVAARAPLFREMELALTSSISLFIQT
jgi:hypothetical protein